MTTYSTHLDRLMTELRLENHELASKANTSRQAIWKLRNGYTRMLPNWAKRLAPHLGVSWQELVEGSPAPADQARADLLAAFDAMDEDQRQALLIMVKGMIPREKPAEPNQDGEASRPKKPEPPRPFPESRAARKQGSSGCGKVVVALPRPA